MSGLTSVRRGALGMKSNARRAQVIGLGLLGFAIDRMGTTTRTPALDQG